MGLIYQNDICSLNELNEDEEMIERIPDIKNEDKYIDIISNLDFLSKMIVLLKYYRNYNQSEISKILNCSQSKVSRIEQKALEIIKKQLI